MVDCTELADRYIAVWNEADAARRRALIARTFTEDVRYLDPLMAAEAPAGIDRLIAGVHDRFPGHRFRRTGGVDFHHDRLRFRWELAPAGGPVFAAGTDFAIIAEDGRISAVTGFLDQAPTAG
ncbi:MAG TPA: nuclear transport factor 2 family protein [Stellaceae bacterium]|nr:nuclear transport factor 2 family protein [Stellaceae bacterium]